LSALTIGRIARAHGIRGEVRVEPFWGESDALLSLQRVTLLREGAEPRELAIASARPVPRAVLVRFESIHDRNAAEALKGALVCAERADLPELEAGEYYLQDLVGARVSGPEGVIGEVTEVRQYPSVDVAVIRTTDGRVAEQALTEPWIERVDVEARELELSSLEGLMF
jgi:16S rRNA processing protein RimM